MAELAKGLERDPQLELYLREKAKELGIELKAERGIARELSASAGLERTRSFDMSI